MTRSASSTTPETTTRPHWKLHGGWKTGMQSGKRSSTWDCCGPRGTTNNTAITASVP